MGLLNNFATESIYTFSDTTKSFLLVLLINLLVGFHYITKQLESGTVFNRFITCNGNLIVLIMKHKGKDDDEEYNKSRRELEKESEKKYREAFKEYGKSFREIYRKYQKGQKVFYVWYQGIFSEFYEKSKQSLSEIKQEAYGEVFKGSQKARGELAKGWKQAYREVDEEFDGDEDCPRKPTIEPTRAMIGSAGSEQNVYEREGFE